MDNEIKHNSGASESHSVESFGLLAGVVIVCTITRMIKSKEKLTARLVAGELLLACCMAVFFAALGAYQSLSIAEQLLLIVPASLGNVRLLQYLLNIANIVHSRGGLK